MLTHTFTTPEAAIDEIEDGLMYNAAVVDLAQPISRYSVIAYSGFDVLNLSKKTHPSVPVVTISTARIPFCYGDASFYKSDGVGKVGELVKIVRSLALKEAKR